MKDTVKGIKTNSIDWENIFENYVYGVSIIYKEHLKWNSTTEILISIICKKILNIPPIQIYRWQRSTLKGVQYHQ